MESLKKPQFAKANPSRMVKCASIVLGLLIGILFVSFYVSTFNDGRLTKIEMIVNSPQKECWEGETVQHSIELTNQSGRVQVVERFYKSCGCSSLSIVSIPTRN